MIHDTAAQIDRILRHGGEFWIVEVGGDDNDPRIWFRGTDRSSIKMDLAAERMRRPDLNWTPKKVTVVTEIEEP